MKWLAFVITSLLVLVHYSHANQKKARSIALKDGDVGEVRTALGYSTILQFDSRPTSVVVGDQDSFKVEYVGDGLTIKPVVPGVKSNLFVFTDYDRFNFRLVATSADLADFLVKVSRGRSKSYPVEGYQPRVETGPSKNAGIPNVPEKKIGKVASCWPVTLTLDKLGVPTSGNFLVLTFILRHSSLQKGQELNFSPGDIEVLQAKKMVPIENLYLDGMSFSRSKPVVRGTLVLKRSEVKSAEPVLAGFSASFVKSPKCLRASFLPAH